MPNRPRVTPYGSIPTNPDRFSLPEFRSILEHPVLNLQNMSSIRDPSDATPNDDAACLEPPRTSNDDHGGSHGVALRQGPPPLRLQFSDLRDHGGASASYLRLASTKLNNYGFAFASIYLAPQVYRPTSHTAVLGTYCRLTILILNLGIPNSRLEQYYCRHRFHTLITELSRLVP